MELVLVIVVLAVVICVVPLATLRQPKWAVGLAFAAILLSAQGIWRWTEEVQPAAQSHEALAQLVPAKSTDDGYVSSSTCRSCHAEHYHSWHRTFHRTMTQAATPAAVKGDFESVKVTKRETVITGQRPDGTLVRQEIELPHFMESRGNEFWARYAYIDAERGRIAEREAQIVMTTGSHHYQMYWMAAEHQSAAAANRRVEIFPYVYLFEAERWIPREAALITPPYASQNRVFWSEVCIRCHSTHGQPRVDTILKESDTRVAELGIACEACHGPAEEHVRVNQSPARRYQMHLADEGDPTIVNPNKLSAERSSQVCGQCHSIVVNPLERDWEKGYWNAYQPGEDVEETLSVVRVEDPECVAKVRDAFDHMFGEQRLVDGRKRADAEFAGFQDGRYWPDGVVRVGGREYNAITASACYDGGKLSCLSCHSMHDSDPEDQLARGMKGNRACVQCHDGYAADAAIEEHTHHPASSAGSLCYNCHMPFTGYGLLKATRNHTIDSPRVQTSVAAGRPTACNQCHLDKTLAWTQQHLKAWYPSTPDVELNDDQREISASVLWAVQGDAGQRALAAWTMDWDDAKQASGESWTVPYLANLLNDPYPAVRFIAARSLRRIEGFADFEYDFLAGETPRLTAHRKALELWRKQTGPSPDRRGSAILLDDSGALDQATFDRLLQDRNDKPLDLNE